MSDSNAFHDLLFEMSNEYRYEILQSLQEQTKRITDLTRKMKLTTTEVRRHVSRLAEASLIQRDNEGYYHITPYGETSLLLFQELEFLSAHSDYFKNHTLSSIPTRFIKRIGELSANIKLSNPMDFIRHTENLIKESKEHVLLLVDQFPMNSLSSIVEAIERGIKIKIIEPRDRILNPDLDVMTSEETQALSRTRRTPLVEQRMVDQVNAYIVVSDARCILAFSTIDGQYDYKGFTVTDDIAHQWCVELFQYYWNEATHRMTAPVRQIERGRISRKVDPSGQIVVVGQEKPEIDAQAVQDAVDNYDEIILSGSFNFGSSMVQISRSIVIRGEGRENDIPITTLYKKGWMFPFRDWDYLFLVTGEDAEVRIENLHFTDFNCTCIGGRRGTSLSIVNNMISIPTGYGRGMTYGAFGDLVLGIHIQAEHSFGDGIVVEGNYLDFAPGSIWGGHISRGGIEEDPEYRPDLFNHEYYFGYGIAINCVSGNVRIENNVVRNINGRGIATEGHRASTKVIIKNNTVVSDVYGSYPFASNEAGAGILAQSVLAGSGPGFNVVIEDNTIKLDKLNYSGIVALGPATSREGAEKLRAGTIRNNYIQLKNGYEGIHVRKCDDFEVYDNKISGEAYYGIRISGRKKAGEQDQSALNNTIESNDMSALQIKEPDKYSNNHADGRMFTGSHAGSATAHVWLDKFSKNNLIKIRMDETMIDEGEDNIIEYC